MKILSYEDGLGICEYIHSENSDVPELQPNPVLNRTEEKALHFDLVKWQLKHLMGEILTTVEASIPGDRQLSATKDIVRKDFGRKINWLFELCGMPGDEYSQNKE